MVRASWWILSLMGLVVMVALGVTEDCWPEDTDCAGDESGLLQHRLASSIRGARAPGTEDEIAALDDSGAVFASDAASKLAEKDKEKVNAFFEMCQAKDAKSRQRPTPKEPVALVQRQPVSPCNLSTHMVLAKDTATGVQHSCCPLGAVHCGGCALGDDTQCLECAGGYMFIGGICTACISENWTDYDNNTCAEITTCSDVKVQGVSSNEACCSCGGGLQAATPFAYFSDTVLLGSEVVLGYPVPRTAVRYSIDPDCTLVSKGITIDGTTGALLRTPDKDSSDGYTDLGSEPWEVSCTLTAHQTPTLNATTTVTIKADFFGYRSYNNRSLLVGSNKEDAGVSGISYMIPLQNYDYMCHPLFKDLCTFQLQCVAQGVDQWIEIDSTYGNLLLKDLGPQAGSPGITGVDTWNEYVGSPGATCQVVVKSKLKFPGLTKSTYQLKFHFPLVNPQTWPVMQLATDQLQATVGQSAPPLYVEPPSSWGDNADYAKPSRFSIACDESPAQASGKKAFAFDTTTGSGTLNDIHFLTVDVSNGAVRFSPPASLASNVLDNLVTTDVRRFMNLTCAVIGHYDLEMGGPNPWVAAPLELDVFDDTCWLPVTAAFLKPSDNYPLQNVTSATTEADCRKACRDDITCTHFSFTAADGCIFPHWRCAIDQPSSQCDLREAQEKVVGCGQRSTCVRVTFEHHWDYSGWYCPKADMGYLGQAYGRTSVTPEDMVWIAPFDPVRDTECSEGEWVMRKPDGVKDFIEAEASIVELNGLVIACLSVGGDLSEVTLSEGIVNITVVSTPSGASLQGNAAYVALENPTCGTPNVTELETEAESEAPSSEGTQLTVVPIVLDDPTTDTPDDHWLHPCSCFSETGWGKVSPVTDDSYNDVPQGSGNQFYPSSFEIVKGEYVCEPGENSLIRIILLKEDVKVENFDAYCEQQCRADGNCQFYYVGQATETKQCRLYQRCTILVREVGVAGTLFGLAVRNGNGKVCRVADPALCHEVSIRREFLGAGVAATEMNPSPRADFLYADLVEQCDFKLLIGQLGIQSCGLGTYSFQPPAFWQGKTPPAAGAKSGQQLQASCWDERYTAVPSAGAGYAALASELQTLTCLSGQWYGPDGNIGLGGFACATCITVAAGTYRELQNQNRVELYFTPRQELFFYVMTNPPQRLTSTGTLVEEPIDYISSTKPVRPVPPYLYGTLTNLDVSANVDSNYCVGVLKNRKVDIASSSLSQVQTVTHSDPNTTVTGASSVYTITAYGTFGSGAANSRQFFAANTDNQQYVSNAYTVADTSATSANSGDYQAIAQGVAFGNQIGMPQLILPVDVKATLKYVLTVFLNGTEYRSADVTLGADYDFGKNTFTPTVLQTVSVFKVGSGSGPFSETVAVSTTVAFTSSVTSKDVMGFLPCDYSNADGEVVNLGWYNGDAQSPGPMLQIEAGGYLGQCLTRSASQYDGSYMIEVAACSDVNLLATQNFGYRTGYLDRLMHNNDQYCVSGVVERPLELTLRLTACESSGSGTQTRGVYNYPYYQANWIMGAQDCWATIDSPNDCSTTCGYGYQTRTITVLSYNRGVGQACPAAKVVCNVAECPEGNGGFLAEMFPAAGLGVFQFRSTARSTAGTLSDCLSFNASGQAEFAVSACQEVVAQQLDSAQVPSMMWSVLRRSVAGGSLVAEVKASAKYSNGNDQMFLADLTLDKSCGDDALIQELRWGTRSGEPGVMVRCAAGVINSLSAVTTVEVDFPRSDLIQTKEGGYCMSADFEPPLGSGATDDEKSAAAAGNLAWAYFLKCDPDDTNQRFYFSGKKIVNVGTTLCLSVYEGAGYYQLKPCGSAQSMEYDADGRIYQTINDVNYCLGWMKAKKTNEDSSTKVAVNKFCMSSDSDAVNLKDGKIEPAQQLMRIGSGVMGLGFASIDCDESTGSVLNSFSLTATNLTYQCLPLGAVGACSIVESPEVDTMSVDLAKVPELDFNCTQGALQWVHPELSSGGDTIKFKYKCCTLTEPAAFVLTGAEFTDSIPPASGVYCANETRDVSGRMTYNQRSWFRNASSGTANTLYFDHLEGEWCVNGTCVANDNAVPTDTALSAADGSWDAEETGNFDYVPSPRGVTPAKKKKRAFPQLVKFNSVQPKYKEECRDEVTPGESGFDRDLMVKEFGDLPSENPCSLVGSGFSYRESDLAHTFKTDGPENAGITSKDAFMCSQRAIDRSGAVFAANQVNDKVNMLREIGEDSLNVLCPAFPKVGLWVGFMAGIRTKWDTPALCGDAVHAAFMIAKQIQYVVHQTKMGFWNENEIADCDPVQAGMARMFCYLHCIRDSARAGNTAVLKSMEGAAKVQTTNNKLLFEYYFGLISDKLDEISGSNSAGLLQDQVKQDFERARNGSSALFQEMSQLMEATRLDERGEASVMRALDRFLQEEHQAVQRHQNRTTMTHGDVQSELALLSQRATRLHSVAMKAGRLSSKADVERQVYQFVTQHQELLKLYNKRLGQYKERAQYTKRLQDRLFGSVEPELLDLSRQVEAQGVETLLMSLDGTWWKLRGVFDTYLKAISNHRDLMQHTNDMLKDYTSMCDVPYASLLQSFHRAYAATETAKKVVQDSWSQAVSLVGLLATELDHGRALEHFARADVLGIDIVPMLHEDHPAYQNLSSLTDLSMLQRSQLCGENPSAEARQAARDTIYNLAFVGRGLWESTMQQMAIVVTEIQGLGHWHSPLGLGKPPHLNDLEDTLKLMATSMERSMEFKKQSTRDALDALIKQKCEPSPR